MVVLSRWRNDFVIILSHLRVRVVLDPSALLSFLKGGMLYGDTEFMESSQRQPPVPDLVDQIAQHLRRHPYALRHAKKLLRHFRASAADVEQAINRVAVPVKLQINPSERADQVLLHLLRHPEDVIDMRRVMQLLHATERDVQQALAKVARYVEDGGEGGSHAGTDKQ